MQSVREGLLRAVSCAGGVLELEGEALPHPRIVKATTGCTVAKNSPANTRDAGDSGSVTGSGRCPGERNGYHSSVLVWRIPWKEEPGRLQSVGLQRVRHD